MDETLHEESAAEGAVPPSEDAVTAESQNPQNPQTAQFGQAEQAEHAEAQPAAQPQDDGFPGGDTPESSGFSWRLPGTPVPTAYAQGGIPNEFDHLFRDSSEQQRRSLMPGQGPIGVAIPGAAGYPQGPVTPGYPPTQALPPADATGQQLPNYQAPTQAEVGYPQPQAPLPSRAYDAGGYQAQPQIGLGGPSADERHTQAIPRVPVQGYGPSQNQANEPDLLLAAAPGRKSSKGPMIAAVGVFVVLIVIAAVSFSGGSKSDKTKKAGGGATPATSPSVPPGVDPAAKAEADAIWQVIAQGNGLRGQAGDAIASVQQCKDVATAKQTFADIAAKRLAQVQAVQKLSADKLPNGSDLISNLANGWQHSADSENNFVNWAADNASCTGKPGANGNYDKAQADGGKAGSSKSSAVNEWNAFAQKYGEQTISITDL